MLHHRPLWWACSAHTSSLFWGCKSRRNVLHTILESVSREKKKSFCQLALFPLNSSGGFWLSLVSGCRPQVLSAELLPSQSSTYCCKGFLLSRWRTFYLSLRKFKKFLPTHSCCLSSVWMTAMILWLHWMCFPVQCHLQTSHRCISITWFCLFVQMNICTLLFSICCLQVLC